MQIPLTFRLVYHGVRATIRAAGIVFLAWIILIPASAEERAALGASANTNYPFGLRPMRAAKTVVALAPDRFYVMAADLMGPEVTPLFLRLAVVQMAAGNVLPQTMVRRSDTPADPGTESSREAGGAKFIRVD